MRWAGLILMIALAACGGDSRPEALPLVAPRAARLEATPGKDLVIVPASLTLTSISETGQLVAVMRASRASANAVTWISLDPAVAGVSPGGRVTACGPGTARIVASHGNRADTARVVVDQVPAVIAIYPVGEPNPLPPDPPLPAACVAG